MIHFRVLNVRCVIMLRNYESRARRTSQRGFSSLLSGRAKCQQSSNKANMLLRVRNMKLTRPPVKNDT